MAPSGRSSLLKYLMKEDNEKHVMLQSYTSMRCEINANYELNSYLYTTRLMARFVSLWSTNAFVLV
jgi:hypothetical protein